MKNTISYYYNLIPNDIHQKEDVYTLIINNVKYIFMPYYGNINNLNTIYNYLINLKIYCHEIIYNNRNSIITTHNDKPYILFKIYYDKHDFINLNQIISYNILVETDKQCNWYDLWCKKLDYYEYQLSEFGKKYPLIRDSFSYYNGLCETSISLLNNIKTYKNNMYISHHRIKKNMDWIDFYNPLNLVIDVRIRDASEYFKNQFFEGKNVIEEINYYLYTTKLNYSETMLLFIRLIYPSYYFDTYDDIIQGKTQEKKLNNYIEKNHSFELFLKKVYNIINNHYYKLPEIEWIIKM